MALVVKTRRGSKRVAVLIPTRGRAALVAKQLQKMPFLNQRSTIYGVDVMEVADYTAAFSAVGLAINCTILPYDNAEGSVGFCREQLRRFAMRRGLHSGRGYDYFVATDDNCTFTEEALTNVVRCSAEFPTQPNLTVGCGELMKYFLKGKETSLPDKRVIHGITSIRRVNHIFVCVPRFVYERFHYPSECLASEDRYLTMWALSNGVTEVRECLDAVYRKPRLQPGGTGGNDERMRATGLGFAKLAHDFPVFVGCTGNISLKWSYIMKLAQGFEFAGRLPGGGVKKEVEVAASMVSCRKR